MTVIRICQFLKAGSGTSGDGGATSCLPLIINASKTFKLVCVWFPTNARNVKYFFVDIDVIKIIEIPPLATTITIKV